jgi:hypothetical protein
MQFSRKSNIIIITCLCIPFVGFSKTESYVGNHSTSYFEKGKNAKESDTIAIYSQSKGTPSYSIEYLPDGSTKVIIFIVTESGTIMYEDTDGDGIMDQGVTYCEESKTSRKFVVKTEKIYQADADDGPHSKSTGATESDSTRKPASEQVKEDVD